MSKEHAFKGFKNRAWNMCVNVALTLMPRKRTMLITTAPWILVLGEVVMTPERRLLQSQYVGYVFAIEIVTHTTCANMFGASSL